MGLALLLASPAKAANFDYYVLALSWSPSFCAETRNAEEAQCSPGKRYAFVVHGLWPQYDRGWPEFCATPGYLPQSLIQKYLDIMPSKRLILHEWRKHGTCSGLTAADYLAETRYRFEKIRIPARYLSPMRNVEITPQGLITDFIKTNPKLRPEHMQLDCGNRRSGRARLQELRICMDVEGDFTACSGASNQTCKADSLVLPPVR